VAGKKWSEIDKLQRTIETVDNLQLSKQEKKDLVTVALGAMGSEEKRFMAAAAASADPQLMTHVEGAAAKSKEGEFQPRELHALAKDMEFCRSHARALDSVREERAVIKSIGTPSNVSVPDQYKALLQQSGSPQSVKPVQTTNDGHKPLDGSIAPAVTTTTPQKPTVSATKVREFGTSDLADKKPPPQPPGAQRTPATNANQAAAPVPQWKNGLSPLQTNLLPQNYSAQTRTLPVRNDQAKTLEKKSSSKGL
jgi:hypothetical protein